MIAFAPREKGRKYVKDNLQHPRTFEEIMMNGKWLRVMEKFNSTHLASVFSCCCEMCYERSSMMLMSSIRWWVGDWNLLLFSSGDES